MPSSSLFRGAAAALLFSCAAWTAHAYSVTGSAWPSGDIVMHLQLGSPAAPLLDGSDTWDSVAEAALADWNGKISRSRFAVVRDSAATRSQGNRANNVFFSNSIYGQSWGSGVLAVTLTIRTSRNTVEADVIFNSNLSWDSYRGGLRRAMDFRRVALHEFGHVLGLDHPDQAQPAQFLSAVMNSRVGNTELLQPDDISGAHALYGAAAAATPPSIVTPPTSASVQTSNSHTLNVVAGGAGPFTYAWSFRPAGSSSATPIDAATGPSYTIGSVQTSDAGTYSVAVSNANGTTTSSATLQVEPAATSPLTLLTNISTRGRVGTGASVLIAGFVITGKTPKNVLLRAAGPALSGMGVTGALANPVLTLLNQAGAEIAANDNWDASGQGAALTATFDRLGAFRFQAGSRDSALLLTLPPGVYTALVSGSGGTSGIALVEAYDADTDAPTSQSRPLVNISTRGDVGTGANILIAGLVVRGPGPHTYLIRASGPSLNSMGVSGTLADPRLQLFRDESLVRENDNWDNPANAQPAIAAAAQRVGAFAQQSSRESAMLVTLQPGVYTARVFGANNGTGIALVEIYEVPE